MVYYSRIIRLFHQLLLGIFLLPESCGDWRHKEGIVPTLKDSKDLHITINSLLSSMGFTTCCRVIRDMIIWYLQWCLLTSIYYLPGQLWSCWLSVWSAPFSALQLGSCRLQLCSASGLCASFCHHSCEAERGRASLCLVCLLVLGVSPQPRFFTPEVTVPSQSNNWIQFAVFPTLRIRFVEWAARTRAGSRLRRVWVPQSWELRDTSTSK